MRVETLQTLEGIGTLRSLTGKSEEVPYYVVIEEHIREGRPHGLIHFHGNAVLGRAIGIAMGDGVVLVLEDGRELKVIFTRVGDPAAAAPFKAAAVNPNVWSYLSGG